MIIVVMCCCYCDVWILLLIGRHKTCKWVIKATKRETLLLDSSFLSCLCVAVLNTLLLITRCLAAVYVHPVALLLVALICHNISPVIKLALYKSANTSKNSFYASASLRMAPKAFYFRVLCMCMCVCVCVCVCLTYFINRL